MISKDLYSNIVNEAIRLQGVMPYKDISTILEELLRDYDFKLNHLTADEKHDLYFQITYSVVNYLRS